MAPHFDTLIQNVKIIRSGSDEAEPVDVGISRGRFAELAPAIDPAWARTRIDGRGLLGFPGLVDAHMHVGIYAPLADDAASESRAAATGGVTTSLNYMRTGRYYLDKGGPYREFFPDVLAASEGRFHVDYGYHLAPISAEHVSEMETLARDYGVCSFKIFMFYGNHGLHGRSNAQNDFLMLGPEERYDVAHFEFVMREIARMGANDRRLRDAVSLSLHCEIGEILSAYSRLVEREGKLTGLPAYSASRPPHSEGLAVFIAAYLADETSCPNINLLHLSSRKAIEAALAMQRLFPHVSFKREVTIGHLLLDTSAPAGSLAKVNPPIRPREDVERLWEAVLAGDVDWVVSDHACCAHEHKVDRSDATNIFAARSGFGGTEYLLSGLFSEGRRRGLSLGRIADLVSTNPARRFGLSGKGEIAVGMDADLVLFDPDERFVVRASESPSAQGYTPFEGMELRGRVKSTFLRGERICHDGVVEGPPRGRYLRRGGEARP